MTNMNVGYDSINPLVTNLFQAVKRLMELGRFTLKPVSAPSCFAVSTVRFELFCPNNELISHTKF